LRKGRGGKGWRRGERPMPNILNIVAWRKYLATFDRQQLATLVKYKRALFYGVQCTTCNINSKHTNYPYLNYGSYRLHDIAILIVESATL